MKKNYHQLLTNLISQFDETEWIEYKENFVNEKELGEYISAISNSASVCQREVGYLIWGIKDNTKEIIGTSFNHRGTVAKSNEVLEHYLARNLFPSVNFKFVEIVVDNKLVVILEIPQAMRIPTSFMNERYLRINSSKVNLRKYPEREVELFDLLKEEKTIVGKESSHQKLTFNKLFVYYAAKGINLNKKTFEKNLALKTESGKYNLLAQLLSDDNHISIRIASYNGKTKSDRMVSIEDFGNKCLLYSFEEISRYASVINKTQSTDDGIIPRIDTTYFDQGIFNEALINAFVHNEWIDEHAPQINVYSDRIEIVSHGGLPKNQSKDDFYNGVSKPRNLALVEIFMQLHISEKVGRGVPRIVKAYGRKAFNFFSKSLVVTIPFNIVNYNRDSDNFAIGGHSLELTPIQKSIIKMIKDKPNITIKDMASQSKISKTAMDKNLTVLRKNKLIKRLGSRKSGYWVVLKDVNGR